MGWGEPQSQTTPYIECSQCAAIVHEGRRSKHLSWHGVGVEEDPAPDKEGLTIWAWEDAPERYKAMAIANSSVNYVVLVPSSLVHRLGELDYLTLEGDGGPLYAHTGNSSLSFALDRLSRDEVLYHRLDDESVVGFAYHYHSL